MTIIMAVVAILAALLAVIATPMRADAIEKWPKSVHMLRTGEYSGVNEKWQMKEYPPKVGGHAQCMDPPLTGVPSNSEWTVKELKDVIGWSKAKTMRHIVYYGPGGPGYKRNSSIWTGSTKDMSYRKRWWFVHCCLGWVNGYGFSDINSKDAKKYIDTVKSMYVPDAFEVKCADWNGKAHKRQRYVIWFNDWKSLTIKKKVAGTDPMPNHEFRFTVTLMNGKKPVDGTIGNTTFKNGKATFRLKAGEEHTLSQIPLGYTWQVSEDDADLYKTTYSQQSGTMGNKNVTVTVTNSGSEGSIIVGKRVTKKPNDKTKFEFTVTVTCPQLRKASFQGRSDRTFNAAGTLTLKKNLADGETWEIAHLPVGATYVVSEERNRSYTSSVPATGRGTIADGTTKRVTVTNEYNAGDLKLVKRCAGNSSSGQKFKVKIQCTRADGTPVIGTYGPATFKAGGIAQLELQQDKPVLIPGLPANSTYKVWEDPVADGTTVSYDNQTGKVKTNTTATVTILNTFGIPIVVQKIVDSNEADENVSFSFHIDVTGPDGRKLDGTYGGRKFVNGRHSFTLRGGQQYEINEIPQGSKYSVTEESSPEWISSSSGATGTVTGKRAALATFTNRDAFGHLSVTKAVTGDTGAARQFRFELSVADASGMAVSGSFPATVSRKGAMVPVTLSADNGTIRFSLAGDETLLIDRLPDGSTYSLSEVSDPLYSSAISSGSGRISGGQTSRIDVSNERKQGDLTIEKTVIDPAIGDNMTLLDETFVFHIRLMDGDYPVNGTYGGVTFTDGMSEPIGILMKEGSKRVISGIPAGCAYEVTEEPSSSKKYVGTIENATGTISHDQPAIVRATNTRGTNPLVIKKTVVDEYNGLMNPDGDAVGQFNQSRETFEFVVQLLDGVIPMTGTYHGRLGGKDHDFVFDSEGKCEIALSDGQEARINDIPIGCSYSVTEHEYPAYATESDGSEGTIPAEGKATARFRNIRQTGIFKMHKRAKGEQ